MFWSLSDRWSYLARAAIDFLNHHFANLQTKEERKAPQILYAGNSIINLPWVDLAEYVSDKDFSVNVILNLVANNWNPAIAFRVFKELWWRNTVKKKPTNGSTQQLTVPAAVKVKQMPMVGKHLVPDDIRRQSWHQLIASNCCIRCWYQSPYGRCEWSQRLHSDKLSLKRSYYAAVRNILYRRYATEILVTMITFNTQNGGNNWLVSQKGKTKRYLLQLLS